MEFQKPLAKLKNLIPKTFSKSEKPEESQEEPKKFGMFQGVFTPMVIIILCMMYLFQPWVVGNAGVFGAILILLLASKYYPINSAFHGFHDDKHSDRPRWSFFNHFTIIGTRSGW